MAPTPRRRQGSEFDTHDAPAASIDCNRSTVDPEETKHTPSPSRARAPDPKTRSVRSKSPSANEPSHTASQNQSAASSTRGPWKTSIAGAPERQRASHASGGQSDTRV